MNKCKICGTEFESKFCPNCGAESDEVQRDLTEKLTTDILKNGIDKVWQTNCGQQAHTHKVLETLSLIFTILMAVSVLLFIAGSSTFLNFPQSIKFLIFGSFGISILCEGAFTVSADIYFKTKLARFIHENALDIERISKSYDIMSLDDNEDDSWEEMYLFLKHPETLRTKGRGNICAVFLNISALVFFTIPMFVGGLIPSLCLWAMALLFYGIGVLIKKSINKSLKKRAKQLLKQAQAK